MVGRTGHQPSRPDVTRCVTCGGTGSRPSHSGLLRQCNNCRHVFAEVDPAALPSLYGRGYFEGGEYRDYLADRDALRQNFAARLRTLERFLLPQHTRLLEVGCAYGVFLDLAQQHFARARGIDISETAVASARARGLDAIVADLPALAADEHFDVICAWDTIEHLARPDYYVESAARLLTGGGLVALTTGDIGSLNARWRGARWRLIHPPTHVHYFSVATLTRLLDRFGLDVVHVEHPAVHRSIGNMLHNLSGGSRLLSLLAEPLVRLVGKSMVTLNLRDVMFVIARKR
jgi:SAM-dependent methyltransferase